MFPGSSSTRSWTAIGAVCLSSSIFCWGGTASAAATDSSVQSAPTGSQVLGMQAATAAWFLLGVVLLVAALLASSRSRRRQGSDVPVGALTLGAPTGREPVSTITAPISAI
jgi:hypothetical protein